MADRADRLAGREEVTDQLHGVSVETPTDDPLYEHVAMLREDMAHVLHLLGGDEQ